MPKTDDVSTETYTVRSDAESVRTQALMRIAPGGISIMPETPETPTTSVSALPAGETIETRFNRLAEDWRKETRYVSSLSKMSMQPSYQKIIGMGMPAVPLILRDLKENGGHWLWALNAITDEDPALEGATFREAVDAWLEWGKKRGLIF
jgi:hypothetical protein